MEVGGKKFEPANQKKRPWPGWRPSKRPFHGRQGHQTPGQAPPAPRPHHQHPAQEAYRKLLQHQEDHEPGPEALRGQGHRRGGPGLITYIRTDSTPGPTRRWPAREIIAPRYGASYLPPKPNAYKSRSGAQDAHEAIRPTGAARTPEDMAQYLSPDELKLYRLIWQRFIACQMAPALFDRTQADIASGKGLLRANGQIKTFPGFTAVYEEGRDNGEEAEQEGLLPPLEQGQELKLEGIDPSSTSPSPRRVFRGQPGQGAGGKGIGRPSTYSPSSPPWWSASTCTSSSASWPQRDGMVVNDLL